MLIEEKLEKIEKEIQSIKMLIIFGNEFAKRKQVSLRGMCRILASEEELEKSIEDAKKSLFSGMHALRN